MATTYYVSKDGNDANNGLGPDPNHASDKPLLTLDHAIIHANTAGDTVYLGPGIYRETNTFDNSGSAGSPISFIGDPLNTKGFKTGAGLLETPGPVILTNFTTDDVTAAAASAVLATNSKDFLTFRNLWIESGSSYNPIIVDAASQNITVQSCHIFSVGGIGILFACAADTNSGHLVDSCEVFSAIESAIRFSLPKTNNAEYDANCVVKNCILVSPAATGVYIISTVTATNYGTGVIAQNCQIIANYGMRTGSTYTGTLTTKCQAKNCEMFGTYGVYSYGASDDDTLVEDYCFLVNTTPRTKVGVGAHSHHYSSSTFDRAIRHDFGQSQLFGFLPKSFLAPWSTSRTIGYGNDSTPTALTTDILNRVRPSGSGVAAASVLLAVGAYELHDYGVKEVTVKDAGDASIKLTGPGDHDIRVPVDASATVISIKARFDSATYGGANYPQAILLDAADIGVSTETKTATIAASDAWETLTFSSFTPTLKGWVVIRLLNRGSGADDICYFDTLAVT